MAPKDKAPREVTVPRKRAAQPPEPPISDFIEQEVIMDHSDIKVDDELKHGQVFPSCCS